MSADPVRFGGQRFGDGGVTVPHHDVHAARADAQFHQDGAGGVLAGVGDQFADDQGGDVARALRGGQVVCGAGLVEEGGGVVAGIGDAGPVSVERVAGAHRVPVRRGLCVAVTVAMGPH
ncbi:MULTISPECIES: hypothetical protein [unclassified Streptomyces]|uniref:hypothetical protein n=1 Tax=unclassified Streptomyces TaxID=2593676 RepID=UPI0035E2E188